MLSLSEGTLVFTTDRENLLIVCVLVFISLLGTILQQMSVVFLVDLPDAMPLKTLPRVHTMKHWMVARLLGSLTLSPSRSFLVSNDMAFSKYMYS